MRASTDKICYLSNEYCKRNTCFHAYRTFRNRMHVKLCQNFWTPFICEIPAIPFQDAQQTNSNLSQKYMNLIIRCSFCVSSPSFECQQALEKANILYKYFIAVFPFLPAIAPSGQLILEILSTYRHISSWRDHNCPQHDNHSSKSLQKYYEMS